MNNDTSSELRFIKDQQSRLETEVQQLRDSISRLELRLQETPGKQIDAGVAKPGGVASHRIEPALEPPPIIQQHNQLLETAKRRTRELSAEQQPAPSIGSPNPSVALPTTPLQARVSPPGESTKTNTLSLGPVPADSSFEMRLGTYWLVRIGIVMVLTALVFFGNLAYHNFISKLGPAGKVGLLYLASFALLGAGTFWLRKTSRDAVKNYAQVLFAGGLAAVYFTTFAAHHFPNLRVIGSPVLDGFLLLAWAGFMAWIADRKKSEVLALFAVGLAYYTSIITRVGYFTLYSNLLLTAAAVYFLVRNRWATLSIASLVATYGAYAFWRFFHGGTWGWAPVDRSLWLGAWLLMAYWALFTVAVFVSRTERLFGPKRAAFLTFNNGAFLACFLLTMFLVREGGLWRVLLIFGSVLLALSAAAGKFLNNDPLTRNAYLTQGLVVVTLGIIAKFSGMTLALMLAGESVILLYMAQQRHDRILLLAAYVSAGLSVLWGMDGFARYDRASMFLGAGLGVLMLANAVLRERATGKGDSSQLQGSVIYFTGLALLTWGFATWHNTSEPFFPLAMALEGLALTLSVYLLRVREVSVLAQGMVLVSLVSWGLARADGLSGPWWSTAAIAGVTLGLSHWWQRQRTFVFEGLEKLSTALQIAFAIAITWLVFWWIAPNVSSSMAMVWSCALALGFTAYGAFTKLWPLAAASQLLLVPAVAIYLWGALDKQAAWYHALAPILAIVALQSAALEWMRRKPELTDRATHPITLLSKLYRWAGVLLSVLWIESYIPSQYKPLFATGVVAGLFALAVWKRTQEIWIMCAVFLVQSLAHIWIPFIGVDTVSLKNVLAIVAIMALQRAARAYHTRLALDERGHTVIILAGGLTLWLVLSRWVLEGQSGFYLTASWSILALTVFFLGFLFRERVYRWLGLGILACALGRVIIFDVWKLETLYRILSFLALGVVLLVLGYVYSRFQEKIRQWL